MKALVLVCASLSLCHLLYAETMIIPTGKGGSLTAYKNGPFLQPPYHTEIVVGGVTNTLPFVGGGDEIPAALAGPLDILFGTGAHHLISYKRMQGNAMKSCIVSFGTTNTIAVPAGKTIRCFSVIPNLGVSVNIRVTQGTNSFGPPVVFRPGIEFAGPVEISLWQQTSTDEAAVYSYYLTDDFLVIPETGFLQGPTGAFEIIVEKSTDLTNWFPVSVQNTTSDQKAFYRLKMSK